MGNKHFVVQGATCSCQFGDTPDKLKVLANDKDYLNDEQGGAKPIASTKDVGQPFSSFGKCTVTRSACTPNISEWKEFYQQITLTNGGKVLTEDSKAICSIGGAPCIKIDEHGQSAAVAGAHFDKVETANMAVLNPMAPKPDTKKELPQVKQIKIKPDAALPLELKSASQKEQRITVVTARIDQPLKFEVAAYYNEAKADTSKVGWTVAGGPSPLTFEEIGPTFDINFDAVGRYRIMAFGNPDPTKRDDPRCEIEVAIVENKLKDQLDIGASVGRIIPGAGGKDPKPDEYRVRRGVPVTIRAKYEMEPATADEKARVHMQVTDAAGNILAGPTSPGTDTITFTPANTAASYRVTAFMSAADTGSASQEVTREMTSEINSVIKVTNDQKLHIVRPGTDMNFSVSQMRYTEGLQDFEINQVKWQLNGQPVGTGTSLSLDGKKYFNTPGEYVVEAYVVQADAWDKKKNKPAAGSAKSEDDWVFEVKKNEIVNVRTKDAGNKWVVGKEYTLIAETVMKYDSSKDGALTWSPAGGSGDNSSKVTVPAKGKYTFTATMGGSSKQLEVDADFAEIIRWCFTDEEGIFKPKAGWKETVKAVINSPQAAGETLSLHILEADRLKMNYIKEAGPLTFNNKGEASLDIKTDDLKPKLEALGYDGKFYDVFFAILHQPTGIKFLDVKMVSADGKQFIFPKKESNQTGKETGKYVYINGEPEVVSVKFFDSTQYPAYKIYPYGEPIKVHIQTRNLAGEEVEFQLWENKRREEDTNIRKEKMKVPDNGILNVDVDTNKLKSGDKNIDNGMRSFYVILRHEKQTKDKKVETFMYPQEVADSNAFNPRDVNYYHHIKLSALSEKMNEVNRPIAPGIIGEAMDPPETPCLCKRYDLIWGDKVSCQFRKKVVELADKLGLPSKDYEGANWLMAVMALETARTFKPTVGTFKKHKDESKQGYVGLIQFGKAAALDLNITRTELYKMTIEEQLKYVEDHFTKRKSKLKTKTDLYLAVNYPAAAGHGEEPNYVVYDSSNAAYDDNPMFKREPEEYWTDKDGKKHFYEGRKGSSYVWEFEAGINDFYNEGKSHKLKDYDCEKLRKLNVKEIITYHIYADGRVERMVPKEIKEEFKDKYKYIYHDKDDKLHLIGIFTFKTIKNTHGDEYGGETVDLVDIRELKNYESGNVKFKLTLNTERYFLNDKTLGSLIGALLECGYEDYTFNGFSHSDGSSRPSKSHLNGFNGDLRYLRTDKAIARLNLFSASETEGWKALDEDRQKKFNDALYKFGWKSMLSQTYNKNKLLNHCKNDANGDHNDHLHIQGYEPKFKEIKE